MSSTDGIGLGGPSPSTSGRRRARSDGPSRARSLRRPVASSSAIASDGNPSSSSTAARPCCTPSLDGVAVAATRPRATSFRSRFRLDSSATRRVALFIGILSAIALIAASPVPIGLLAARRTDGAPSHVRDAGGDGYAPLVGSEGASKTVIVLPVSNRALRRHLEDRLFDSTIGSGMTVGSTADYDPLLTKRDGIFSSEARSSSIAEQTSAKSIAPVSVGTARAPSVSSESALAAIPSGLGSTREPRSEIDSGQSSSSNEDGKPLHLPIFNDISASLVRAEMDTVRRKYADAMRFLRGAPLAKVDVLVDPGVNEDVGKGEVVVGDGNVTTPEAPSAPAGANVDGTGKEQTARDKVLAQAPDVALAVSHEDRQAKQDLGQRSLGAGLVKRGRYDSPAVPLVDWVQGWMDVLYYGDVRVGEPEQVLGVDFDTGSADLWVPTNCQSCHHNYQPSRSSQASSTGQRFEVQYGSGRVSGTLFQDIVRLGSWTVPNQYLGAVDQLSDDFAENPNDGVMGMAFSSIAFSGKKTFFENLIDQGSVKAPIFSFHLTRRKPQGSQLCIGCYDSSKYRGGFTWIPIISKTYWSVSMTGFTADGNKANALSRTLIGAVDTGTTLIYVPPRVAASFYKQIPGSSAAPQFGQGFYQYPCAADTELHLALGFNGKGFKWDVSDFNLGRTGHGSSMCVGAILTVADGFPEDLAIIGDVFMKSWYTIFDQSNDARIGLAGSVNNA